MFIAGGMTSENSQPSCSGQLLVGVGTVPDYVDTELLVNKTLRV
jgi:hypothetical protein